MSILQKLTEGVQSRDLRSEGAALLNKWEATGLLEGLGNENQKQGMAVLLENQAKELLREASAMAAGDVEGFAAVAFPIVRRVFGGLIANDLVSVQPMSLPSGLIFFLDFVKSPDARGDASSVYGGNVVAKELQQGVNLGDASNGLDAGGFYDFNTGFTHATASLSDRTLVSDAGGSDSGLAIAGSNDVAAIIASEALSKEVRYDPDLLSLATDTHVVAIEIAVPGDLNRDALAAVRLLQVKDFSTADGTTILNGAPNATTLEDIVVDEDGSTLVAAGNHLPSAAKQIKRLTQIVKKADGTDVLRLFIAGGTANIQADGGSLTRGTSTFGIEYPKADDLAEVTNGIGAVNLAGAAGGTANLQDMPLERAADMAEIDIKVDSIAVTAQTKKLKAKWSPELGQDLNAYHNLDAEVELTGILSEQIALEIDRELLGDLVQGATAGTRYWSRAPGLFVDSAGTELGASSAAPDFTGTVSEWYETLIETINDVSAQIHRKTLRGGANFVVCSPEVANILEFTSGFRASVTADQDRGTIGAVKSGSLSKKFDVYVDPYFLRNVILVGRKGGSFLESGFVYAPYVPLQVTPTIFGTEDFVPRKGVMTRYAKKMVRPDMYGLVVVRGLLGESGA